MIQYLYAALEFLTKSTLLAAIKNGHLFSFPSLAIKNLNKHFSESDKTQNAPNYKEKVNFGLVIWCSVQKEEANTPRHKVHSTTSTHSA